MRKLMFFLLMMLFSMAASAADAVKQDYVLGAGDVIRISVYGNPDLATETRVSSTGTITFPLLGEIMVNNISVGETEKRIAKALEEGGFLKQPQVNIVVLQFQSQMVSVLGDVYKPGRFPLDRPSTLTDLLAMAGGLTANGSELVTITSISGEQIQTREYDLREVLLRGNAAQNPAVRGGDIIHVNAREVSVLGQVNRPGKYSLVSGVRTVGDFLSMAGGIAAGGSDTIVVTRVRDGQSQSEQIDVDQTFRSGHGATGLELRGGDMIYVPREPRFYIYGEVQRPGVFRLERNMSVAQALSMGGGLTPRGTERGLQIKRRDDKGLVVTIEPKPSDTVQPDDVLYVQESLF